MLQTENLVALASEIAKLIDSDKSSIAKKKMRDALAYYDYKHDILNYRLFYFDDNDVLQEEKYRSNTKIAHGFFTELVDQKVQYLLSNPVEVTTKQKGLQDYLVDYINEDFQLMLQELVEGASQKAVEYVFWRTQSDGKITFETADALNTIFVYDENKQVAQVIYYVERKVTEEGKNKTITDIQFWTNEEVYYFTKLGDEFAKLDMTVPRNPAPHIVAEKQNGEFVGKGYDRVPFLSLVNNRRQTTDLAPIKDLIDDYDLMACALSNNLIDFDHPIYAVKGFNGDNLSKLVTNLKTKKTIGVSDNGGIEVKTVDIPVEARKEKLRIDKEAIYKFGMGFDSSQTGDGNITNVVIKSRYSLLDLKCNKLEIRLRKVIKQMLELIVENINTLHSKHYDTSDIEITITRDVMANEVDNATIAKIEAETKHEAVTTVLDAAARLDDRTALDLLAEVLDIDPEKVQKALDEQGYQGDFSLESEVEDESVSEGNRASSDFAGQAD